MKHVTETSNSNQPDEVLPPMGYYLPSINRADNGHRICFGCTRDAHLMYVPPTQLVNNVCGGVMNVPRSQLLGGEPDKQASAPGGQP